MPLSVHVSYERYDIINFINLERYCISISSSNSAFCVSPDGINWSMYWTGSTAKVLHNGVQIGTLPYGYTHSEFCIDEVDVVNDKFKIVNGGNNGVRPSQ